MNKEIERQIQIATLRELQIKLKQAELDHQIIPDIVYEIVRDLEDNYNQHVEPTKDN